MSTGKLSLGSPMPEFRLMGTDKNYYTPESCRSCEAMVIIFSCNHCPYVQAYEERIKKIQEDYAGKVKIMAINSNDGEQYPDDSFDNMVIRSLEREFNFPYLHDETQEIARAFDATHTPEVFIFNKERKLVFHGKIDDNWKSEENVENSYVRDALDELLAGKEISMPETFTIGCTIKWKNIYPGNDK